MFKLNKLLLFFPLVNLYIEDDSFSNTTYYSSVKNNYSAEKQILYNTKKNKTHLLSKDINLIDLNNPTTKLYYNISHILKSYKKHFICELILLFIVLIFFIHLKNGIIKNTKNVSKKFLILLLTLFIIINYLSKFFLKEERFNEDYYNNLNAIKFAYKKKSSFILMQKNMTNNNFFFEKMFSLPKYYHLTNFVILITSLFIYYIFFLIILIYFICSIGNYTIKEKISKEKNEKEVLKILSILIKSVNFDLLEKLIDDKNFPLNKKIKTQLFYDVYLTYNENIGDKELLGYIIDQYTENSYLFNIFLKIRAFFYGFNRITNYCIENMINDVLSEYYICNRILSENNFDYSIYFICFFFVIIGCYSDILSYFPSHIYDFEKIFEKYILNIMEYNEFFSFIGLDITFQGAKLLFDNIRSKVLNDNSLLFTLMFLECCLVLCSLVKGLYFIILLSISLYTVRALFRLNILFIYNQLANYFYNKMLCLLYCLFYFFFNYPIIILGCRNIIFSKSKNYICEWDIDIIYESNYSSLLKKQKENLSEIFSFILGFCMSHVFFYCFYYFPIIILYYITHIKNINKKIEIYSMYDIKSGNKKIKNICNIDIKNLKFKYYLSYFLENQIKDEDDKMLQDEIYPMSLKGVNLNITSNNNIITGHNGCGKSTLINVLTNNYVGTISGEINIGENNMDEMDFTEKQKKIKIIKNFNFPSMTLRDFFFLLFRKELSNDILGNIISEVGLEDKFPNGANDLDEIVNSSLLSDGQRQRLFFSYIFGIPYFNEDDRPKIIFFDEAFRALSVSETDINNKKKLQEKIFKILKQYNITVIRVEHEEERDIYNIDGDNLIIMNDGVVEEIIDLKKKTNNEK